MPWGEQYKHKQMLCWYSGPPFVYRKQGFIITGWKPNSVVQSKYSVGIAANKMWHYTSWWHLAAGQLTSTLSLSDTHKHARTSAHTYAHTHTHTHRLNVTSSCAKMHSINLTPNKENINLSFIYPSTNNYQTYSWLIIALSIISHIHDQLLDLWPITSVLEKSIFTQPPLM